jgi:hypothetical protein
MTEFQTLRDQAKESKPDFNQQTRFFISVPPGETAVVDGQQAIVKGGPTKLEFMAALVYKGDVEAAVQAAQAIIAMCAKVESA